MKKRISQTDLKIKIKEIEKYYLDSSKKVKSKSDESQ